MKSKFRIVEKRIYKDKTTFVLDTGREVNEKEAIKLTKKGNIVNVKVVNNKGNEYIRANKGENISVYKSSSNPADFKVNIDYRKFTGSVKKDKIDFERKVYKDLIYWKEEENNVLYLTGPRQVGKTYLLKKFGREHFKNCIYITLSPKDDESRKMTDRFKYIFNEVMFNRVSDDDNSMRDVWETILYNVNKNFTNDENTLVIFDEIQNDIDVFNCIRQMHLYIEARVAVTGSYLGLSLIDRRYFLPAGDITTVTLNGLSYEEFLDANNILNDYNSIKSVSIDNLTSQERDIYNKVEGLYNVYCQIGGYPEVIKVYLESHNIDKAKNKVKELFNMYLQECRHYFVNIIDNNLLLNTYSIVFQSLMNHVLNLDNLNLDDLEYVFFRDNNITKKEKIYSIRWLSMSHMIEDCKIVDEKGIISGNKYKFYFNDLGILTFIADYLNMSDYYGMLAENFVYLYLLDKNINKNILTNGISRDNYIGSLITNTNNQNLEVDFILTTFKYNKVALEVKHSNNKAISSDILLNTGKIGYIVKFTNTFGGVSKDGKQFTIPLFAITKADDLIKNL